MQLGQKLPIDHFSKSEIGQFSPIVCAGRIRELVRRGGPDPREYHALDWMVDEIYRRCRTGEFTPPDLALLQEAFGDAFSTATLQGFCYRKPHGYAGDFEIIDRIYTRHESPAQEFARWDRYYHTQAATQAVRNRKDYFLDFFRNRPRPEGRPLEALNLASGPGRDMLELFRSPGSEGLRFDCVEQDPDAISHASGLCRDFAGRLRFIRDSAVTFKADRQYDVIWSAGLFDYFEDNLFRRMLRKLAAAVRPGGEIVLGNFSPSNPSRAFMHLFEWPLHYRDEEQLLRMAGECGAAPENIRIGREPLGINLFLHIRFAADGTTSPGAPMA